MMTINETIKLMEEIIYLQMFSISLKTINSLEA